MKKYTQSFKELKIKRDMKKLNFGCGVDIRECHDYVDIQERKNITKSFDFNEFLLKDIRKILRELTLKWICPQRYIMERKIFPEIRNKKVLLIGVADYTSDYPERLKNNELWSIDINPLVDEFGAENHIIGDAVKIDQYFDMILLT